jgi:GMP synthase (glutamine-hydrolysing)
MARIAVLQHLACENEGVFGEPLRQAGHALTRVPLCEGAAVPSPDAYDAWLVMGGPMNVDETDEHAYLGPERELLGQLIAEDAPVLGICLGCQLLARAAGARVYPQRPKEIGLFEIELTPEASADPLFGPLGTRPEVFQWHGDTYDLPSGAVQLARSQRFEQQAFRLGKRIYGLQFHLECTQEMVTKLAGACASELAELPPGDGLEGHLPRLEAALVRQNTLARDLIGRWSDLL